MKNIIFDLPTTFDCAGALALAAESGDINIAGLSATYHRELSAEDSACGLESLKAELGLGLAVARGAEGPIFDDYRWPGFPAGGGESSRGEYAWDLFYKKALELGGDLEIVAAGPLTNIAVFIKKYHDSRRLIKKVHVLGSTKLFGDAASYSEFNIWADPLAAEILSDSEIPFELYGLDLIAKARFTED